MIDTDLKMRLSREFENLSILYIEDNLIERRAMKQLIGNDGFELVMASSTQQALNILSKAPFDVILMNVHMSGMHGTEATSAIRDSGEVWANIPIIALSNTLDYRQKKICRDIGMTEILSMPISRKDLIEALYKVSTKHLA